MSTGVGVGGTDGVVKDVGDGSYVLLPITCLLVPKRGNYMVNNEGNGDAIMGSQGKVLIVTASLLFLVWCLMVKVLSLYLKQALLLLDSLAQLQLLFWGHC